MSTSQAKVSIVIPAFNAGWCINRAVDSVLQQSLPATQIIVVNDGSTDDTVHKLECYGDRIRLVTQENGGLSNARNTGIAEASGQFVAFLDADDWWEPTKLEQQVQMLNQHADIGFCSTAARIVNEAGQQTGVWLCPEIQNNLLETIFMRNASVAGSGSAVMARRQLFEEVGNFDETLKSLEDIDMWMRLASVSQYCCIPRELTVIHKHSDSMSGNRNVMQMASRQVLTKNRQLLSARKQGRFWQQCYAGQLADYAKWEYRDGLKLRAIKHLAEGLARAPLAKGRMMLGLMAAIALGRAL